MRYKKALAFIIVLIALLLTVFYYIQMNSYIVVGWFEIIEKSNSQEEYSITVIIGNKRVDVRCNQEQYSLLEVSTKANPVDYHLRISYNKLFPQKGTLLKLTLHTPNNAEMIF